MYFLKRLSYRVIQTLNFKNYCKIYDKNGSFQKFLRWKAKTFFGNEGEMTSVLSNNTLLIILVEMRQKKTLYSSLTSKKILALSITKVFQSEYKKSANIFSKLRRNIKSPA